MANIAGIAPVRSPAAKHPSLPYCCLLLCGEGAASLFSAGLVGLAPRDAGFTDGLAEGEGCAGLGFDGLVAGFVVPGCGVTGLVTGLAGLVSRFAGLVLWAGSFPGNFETGRSLSKSSTFPGRASGLLLTAGR